jgi:hypothetical protein
MDRSKRVEWRWVDDGDKFPPKTGTLIAVRWRVVAPDPASCFDELTSADSIAGAISTP